MQRLNKLHPQSTGDVVPYYSVVLQSPNAYLFYIIWFIMMLCVPLFISCCPVLFSILEDAACLPLRILHATCFSSDTTSAYDPLSYTTHTHTQSP